MSGVRRSKRSERYYGRFEGVKKGNSGSWSMRSARVRGTVWLAVRLARARNSGHVGRHHRARHHAVDLGSEVRLERVITDIEHAAGFPFVAVRAVEHQACVAGCPRP